MKNRKRNKPIRDRLISFLSVLLLISTLAFLFSSVILTNTGHHASRRNQNVQTSINKKSAHYEAVKSQNDVNYSYASISKKMKNYGFDSLNNGGALVIATSNIDDNQVAMSMLEGFFNTNLSFLGGR